MIRGFPTHFLEGLSSTHILIKSYITMKTKANSSKADKDKNKQGHENQNIHDFNPSQFVEENDVEKKKKKDVKKKHKDKEE